MAAKFAPFLALLCILVAPVACAAQPAPAQNLDTARAFLVSVYRHYQNGRKGIDFTGSDARLAYHSSLLALIRADLDANGPDNVPAIDFDPICGCQDWEGIWDLKIDLQAVNPQRVTAIVTFSLAAPKGRAKDSYRKLEITLAPEQGGWRIYDIVDESDPANTVALRKLLQDDTAAIRHNAGSGTAR
jgi:hypothetical protein